MYLRGKPSKLRLREAEKPRRNRLDIVKAFSIGQVTRRELLKWGLFTVTGALAWKHGLNPFVRSAYANIPTGFPPSPLGNVKAFSTEMPRFDVLERKPMDLPNKISALNPFPTEQANVTQQTLNAALVAAYPGGNQGPIEGRPPGPVWAHQRWNQFLPRISIEGTQEGAKNNTVYNPGVAPIHNNNINPATSIPVRFHPGLATQNLNRVWTFNGTVPPKLVIARY